MKEKFKNKYRIKSLRKQGYDYSQNGAYFITICTKDKKNYFGEIENDKMVLSDIGNIANKYWKEISNNFSFVELDEFVIMPNHVHGILIINSNSRDAINRVSTNKGGVTGRNNPMLHNSISRFVRWYKGRCTFEINKLCKNAMNLVYRQAGCVSTETDFAWQSRFYDRIIRNHVELNKIREYIQINPREWGNDKNNIDNCINFENTQ